MRFLTAGVVLLIVFSGCTSNQMPGGAVRAHPTPPDAAGAPTRLVASPRHGEWVMIRTGPADSLRAWVVYPERSTKAPVVVVVQEIYGLTPWISSVADQLAADGYIAIAPDFLTMKNIPEGPDSVVAPSRGCRYAQPQHGGRAEADRCSGPVWNVAAGRTTEVWNRWVLLGRRGVVRPRGSLTNGRCGRSVLRFQPGASGSPVRARSSPWALRR